MNPIIELLNRNARITWLRFTIQNSSSTQFLEQWHYLGRQYLIHLYALDSLDHFSLQAMTGEGIPANALTPGDDRHRMAVPINLAPNQRLTYFLCVTNIQSLEPLELTLYSEQAYKTLRHEYAQSQLSILAFYIGLIACLLFMGAFALAQYLTNRDRIYAWYSFYLISICFHFIRLPEALFQLTGGFRIILSSA